MNLDNLLVEVKNEVKDFLPFSKNIANHVKITNTKKTLGSCHRTRICDVDIFQIRISKYLLNCSIKDIKDVLMHELIHTCKNCFNHGNNFMLYMNKLNRELGSNICIKSNNKEFRDNCKSNYKYKITCLNCGKVFYRDRLPKDRTGLTHARCGGELKIEEILNK